MTRPRSALRAALVARMSVSGAVVAIVLNGVTAWALRLPPVAKKNISAKVASRVSLQPTVLDLELLDDDPYLDWYREVSPDGWRSERLSGFPAYHLVHISRTAGTSLTLELPKYLPDGVGLYSLEGCFPPMQREVGPKDRLIVTLRSPVSHVYSLFLECADGKWGKNVTQGYREQFTNLSTWLDHFVRTGTNEVATDDFHCYHPLNMQTRALTCQREGAGGSHHYQATDVMQAIDNANSEFTVLGLTEYYQQSVCLLVVEIGGSLPTFCNCSNESAWTSFNDKRVNHGVRVHDISDLSPSDISAILALTEEDRKLYAAAKEHFMRRIARVEDRYGTRLMC